MPPFVPPIKCQGIKTKLVDQITGIACPQPEGRWIEPFCGSGVVALNVQPQRALLADTNVHIIKLYKAIQSGSITPGIVRQYLESEGENLKGRGEDFYYEVRERFNIKGDSLDFLFLNRSCFNGVMRFNRQGKFNVPFGHKPNRFAPAYITKIVNQVRNLAEILSHKEWQFEVMDFRETLKTARQGDLVYVDPPYAGRHVDYFNSWDEADETTLVALLKNLPCRFILSTWHSNQYRENAAISQHWQTEEYYIQTTDHFYYVGATEELRNSMKEALITNYYVEQPTERADSKIPNFFQPALF
jgi:DNA adenine methylase